MRRPSVDNQSAAKAFSPRESHQQSRCRATRLPAHALQHNTNKHTPSKPRHLFLSRVNALAKKRFDIRHVKRPPLPHPRRRFTPQHCPLAEAAPTLAPTSATRAVDGEYVGSGKSDAYDSRSGAGHAWSGWVRWCYVSCPAETAGRLEGVIGRA